MKLRTYLARIKRKILKKPFLKDTQFPPFWFDKLLKNEKAIIVQIGSNDGKTGDPLHGLLQKNKTWSALFVEPIPYVFEQLKKNYSNSSRFKFENAAINNGERLTFFWVDPKAKEKYPDLPYWFDQLGSFNKQHILNHFDGKLEPFIIAQELEGLTLANLLLRHEVENIDILHIDTEGHDWNILSQLDLKKHNPKFILFEHNHLSESEMSDAISFLKENYQLFKIGIDMLAVNRRIKASILTDLNQSLLPKRITEN